MKPKILVIGSNSFIARQWNEASDGLLNTASRVEVAHDLALGCDVIANCTCAPEFKEASYRESADCDLAAARLAADVGAHFVMLSTRKVYAPTPQTQYLDEASVIDPVCHYGRNKLESERRIEALLGSRCTILRVANVYGFELGRRSFFGMAMTRLKNDAKIVLDVSPFVQRDFIAGAELAAILNRVCEILPAGVYNAGSGIGLPLGRIAQWLIQGYGRGSLEISHIDERDGFIMQIDKLRAVLQLPVIQHDFEHDIKRLGQQLNK